MYGTVISSYVKKNKNLKPYQSVHILSDKMHIYSRIWKKTLKQGEFVRFRIIKKRISFKDFLSRRFFAPIYKIRTMKTRENFKHKIEDFISHQHKNEQIKELYGALFLAIPIGKELRKEVQNWGISHLIAISGFHLGVLYTLIFFILKTSISPFHERFFPYININIYLGFVIFFLLGIYMVLIDFSPSFMRAYMMSLVGFFLYIKEIKIVSFSNLFLSVSLLITISPYLVFSIGFWLSVSGVFYIFLYLQHFKRSNIAFDAICINIWVFFGLSILVHYYFSYISYQQFAAMILSVIFVAFYPLMLLLHLIGYGGIFDELLIKFFHISYTGWYIKTPLWGVVLYVILSLLSIRYRYVSLIVVGCGLLLFFV